MYRFHNFLEHISPGSDAEILQTFTFQVVAVDPRYFATQPAASAFGTLDFETALNVNGNTTISARLLDSSESLNTSPWQV